jgi:hypothetical protein
MAGIYLEMAYREDTKMADEDVPEEEAMGSGVSFGGFLAWYEKQPEE